MVQIASQVRVGAVAHRILMPPSPRPSLSATAADEEGVRPHFDWPRPSPTIPPSPHHGAVGDWFGEGQPGAARGKQLRLMLALASGSFAAEGSGRSNTYRSNAPSANREI